MYTLHSDLKGMDSLGTLIREMASDGMKEVDRRYQVPTKWFLFVSNDVIATPFFPETGVCIRLCRMGYHLSGVGLVDLEWR